MYNSLTIEFLAFFPEFFLSLSSCFFLLVFVYLTSQPILKNNQVIVPIVQKQTQQVAFFILMLTLGLVHNNPYGIGNYFFGTLRLDSATYLGKISILIFSIFILLLFSSYFLNLIILSFEYLLFFLISLLSIIFLVSANDFIILYLSLELQALCFYTLTAFKRDSAFSTESGLKYLIIGSFVSGLMLFGISIIYGFSGTTNYTTLMFLFTVNFSTGYLFSIFVGFFFVLVAFMFKLNGAPFHQWAIDVYEGAPSSTTVFFSIIPKLPLFFALIRLLNTSFGTFYSYWYSVFIFVGLISIIFSLFGSMYQKKLKRFILYSTVGHVGYMLLSLSSGTIIGYQGVFIYLLVYILMIFCFWALFLSFFGSYSQSQIKFIDELWLLVRDNRYVSITLSVIFLSMAGIPPLIGFYVKFYVFSALVEVNSFFCCLFIIFGSALSCFYYLRVIKIIFFGDTKKIPCIFITQGFKTCLDKKSTLLISLLMFTTLFIFIHPNLFYFLTYKTIISSII